MKPIRWHWLCASIFAYATSLQAAQGTALVETKVKTLLVDPHSQSPVLVLETVADGRRLPIWIDGPEARAIAMELEQIKAPRPLTHDLIRDILQKIGASVRRVAITDLRNNTYLALLSLNIKGEEVEIDCRPSDAIAIALRMKAPIFAAEQVLAKSKPLPDERGAQKQLGIDAQNLTAELAQLLESQQQDGVLVATVAPGSIAAKAGIERGDIITKADDKPVRSAGELESMIQSLQTPARIKLEVIRKGKPVTVVIELPS